MLLFIFKSKLVPGDLLKNTFLIIFDIRKYVDVDERSRTVRMGSN